MAQVTDYIQMCGKLIVDQVERYTLNQLKLSNSFRSITSKLLKHMHACHGHPCCHTYNGKTLRMNNNNPLFIYCKDNCHTNIYFPDFVMNSAVLVLMREMSSESDCDGNNLVFTIDFLFKRDDNQVPKVIQGMQRLFNNNISLKRYSWNEFLNSVSPHFYLR